VLRAASLGNDHHTTLHVVLQQHLQQHRTAAAAQHN
jgi:hypothetical protein